MMANKKGWLNKWVRWRVVIEILILLAVEAILAGVLICFYSDKDEALAFAQLLITAMIAVGGGYGLILASRRSAKFSEQVDTGQKQLFNEQLGRGVELLTRKEMVMRRTGIRVLEDLAETTINKPEQVELIMRIIHDFVHEKTSSPSKSKGKLNIVIAGGRKKLDIALSIKTILSLYHKVDKSNDPDGFIKLLRFSERHLEGLDFNDARLQEANFRNAKLQGVNFRNAELQKADFDRAELEWADCTNADFLDAKNLTKEQVKVMIFRVGRPPTLPKDLKKNLNKNLCYKWKLPRNSKSGRRYRYFVESKAKWSGKRVFKYLASIRDS